MNFACIHDCSVCPFYGLDVASRVYHSIDKDAVLPPGLKTEAPTPTPENTEVTNEPIEPETPETPETENLPATQDLQYEVSDVKKKSFFSWRNK